MRFRKTHRVVFLALFIACFCDYAHSQSKDSLRSRIIDYSTSHASGGKCRNPIVEIRWNILKVVRFEVGRPVEADVAVQELTEFLNHMPLSAWPCGPRLWLRESDANYLPQGLDLQTAMAAKHHNMTSVIQVCDHLELTCTTRNGRIIKGDE